jgi:hypothetical protein
MFGAIDNGPRPGKRKDMTLSRRDLGFGFAAVAALAALPASAQSGLSEADRAVLNQAQAYLQNLTAAQGTFVETGGGGQRREGRFYLQRPGRMRFEYTTPAGLLVVSDGSNVKRWDPRLEVFRQVPLGQTPLSTFLARNVRLDQGVTIERVTRMQSAATAGMDHHGRAGRAHADPADHPAARFGPGRQPLPPDRPDATARTELTNS